MSHVQQIEKFSDSRILKQKTFPQLAGCMPIHEEGTDIMNNMCKKQQILRISSLLQGSFAKETHDFKEPTSRMSYMRQKQPLVTHHVQRGGQQFSSRSGVLLKFFCECPLFLRKTVLKRTVKSSRTYKRRSLLQKRRTYVSSYIFANLAVKQTHQKKKLQKKFATQEHCFVGFVRYLSLRRICKRDVHDCKRDVYDYKRDVSDCK